MNQKNATFFDNLKHWKTELLALHKICLANNLEEDFKWMHPCYTHNNKNIIILHGFKAYCAVLFFKGSLLKDESNILIQQTENTKAARQIRFKNIEEILALEDTITNYIEEAIHIEKFGLKVETKNLDDYEIPLELAKMFKENKDLKMAFNNLTKGRQKGYLLHFNAAKQSKTKIARISKNEARILSGKGLTDCICGLSKRMPNCDGSHKYIVNQ